MACKAKRAWYGGGRRAGRRHQGRRVGMSQKNMLILAAAVAVYFVYTKQKAANVLNDRYPMAYKS